MGTQGTRPSRGHHATGGSIASQAWKRRQDVLSRAGEALRGVVPWADAGRHGAARQGPGSACQRNSNETHANAQRPQSKSPMKSLLFKRN
jgi:hypothetical protein